MLISRASLFFAWQGPIKTVTASGSRLFTSRETAHIGLTEVEILSLSSGKCLRIILTKAGQQEVVLLSPFAKASAHSSASAAAVISPPRETSIISSKPAFFSAMRQESGVMSGPNCPSTAGATMATTLFPARIIWITSTRKVFAPRAPKGQAWMQWPHWMHLLSSIMQSPVVSSIVIAFAGQACLQGRT